MNRLIASLLMICLLVGLLPALPVETQAAEVAATGSGLLWTDFAADGFEGGDGRKSENGLFLRSFLRHSSQKPERRQRPLPCIEQFKEN